MNGEVSISVMFEGTFDDELEKSTLFEMLATRQTGSIFEIDTVEGDGFILDTEYNLYVSKESFPKLDQIMNSSPKFLHQEFVNLPKIHNGN